MEHYDLVVIGAGPAGEKWAAQAAYFKKRVALIEKGRYVGGSCVNTGTIPSKTLRETALHLSGFAQREVYGVDLALKRNVSIADLMNREQFVVMKERQIIEANIERHQIARYHGAAKIQSPHEVAIEGADGTTVISADFILIASGSAPFRPATVPFDDRVVCDSDSILNLDRIPKTLAVVGAGVIGCEYASIFGALGVKVVLVDGRTTLLPHIDREIAKILLADFQTRLNIDLYLGSNVKSITVKDDQAELLLENGFDLKVERVLFAAGRASNTANLGLENVGIATGKNGLLSVNEKFQTTVPNIYAAGDVIGFPALASTSMEQARVAMVHAFDLKYKTEVSRVLPFAIYTIPELASVGMTEQEAKQKGLDVEIGRAFFRNNARGLIIGDRQGLVKLIFEPVTLKLLGVHIIGENASDLLHIGMMVMEVDGTIEPFIDCVFNFPTLGEAYKYAAYDGLGAVARRGRNVKGAAVPS